MEASFYNHIIGLLVICIIIIVIEGVVIHTLVKKKREKIFRDTPTGDLLESARNFWGTFVVYVVSTSVILLFIASFLAGKDTTLDTMNTWVSLILGMVALIIGIISLFLSFYNVEQSIQASRDNRDDIEKMQERFRQEMNDLKRDIEDKIEESYKKTVRDVNQGRYETHGGNISVNEQSDENSWE